MPMRRLLPFLLIVFVFLSFGAAADERIFFQWLDQFFEKKHYSTTKTEKESHDSKNPFTGGFSSTSAIPVELEIAGKTYWIPAYYIDSVSHSKQKVQEGILLFARLPDFAPRLEEKRDMSVAFKNVDVFVSIHLEDNAKHPRGFRNIYEYSREQQPTLKFQKEIHDLHLEIPQDPKTFFFNVELYLQKDETGDMVSYITCDHKKQRRSLGCTHHFLHDGIIIEIRYRKKHLPNWKTIQSTFLKLFKTFENRPDEGAPI